MLQGPGCLNYTLVLRIEENGPLHSISIANQFIMRKNRAALEKVVGKAVAVRGHTDLVIGERKFSGNSQRRHQRFLLFHGTFLLHFDLVFVSELLLMPSKQPDYRESRSHADFLMNLNLSADVVKHALQGTWNATLPLDNFPREKITALAQQKYADKQWNFKFV